ncbi:hypothetical protein TraAM80_00562 [Trypanosoma rangeli]|uniref:Uncharacterized protein n=1 Tax=Trypanosoma rangeli TaxID=5698 RepID=A0A422P2R2_TRYRA|nr:uncharacterized protein TraAM80_00562 [Trypanosoma rangeli]RNF12002.1 hypothetical protein TraAM80_00562 [Trypanosoma rangeli]|eukprot:RNF12002.1 hypothetical protein TraAM80_00562 [Trypanosoma rangeli]
MNYLSLYRSLLKRIHAAHRHPHHLQDIRFILSYPPVDANSCTSKTSCERCDFNQQQQQRAGPSQIVRACCEDLRCALLPSTGVEDALLTSPALSPVAQQFINLRELVWLKTRLEKIVSDSTQKIVREAEMVASELSENDFLDDAVFDEKDPTKNLETDDALMPHSDSEGDERATGVASAAELGLRREMFVLRHLAPFPLAKHYLSSFNMEPRAVLAAATSTERLIDFARRHIPRRVECRNADLTLTVSVRLFDAALQGKLPEQGSPFSQAYRCFMLQFDLQPHDPAARIEVVNSYFLRLDVASSELLEDVGYVHAAHVWTLVQEPFRGIGKCGGSSGNGDCSDSRNAEAAAEEDYRHNQNEGENEEVLSRFELSFVNPGDNPMVMKGQLYYVLRMDSDKSPTCELPVRVISFGHLLLFNGNE